LPLNAKDFALKAVRLLKEKKAIDIRLLDIGQISILADYFILCTGASSTQTQALCDYLMDELPQNDYELLRVEGYKEAAWILLDFGVLIIHIFLPDERNFYNLERLWGGAEGIDVADVSSISS